MMSRLSVFLIGDYSALVIPKLDAVERLRSGSLLPVELLDGNHPIPRINLFDLEIRIGKFVSLLAL